MICNFYGKKVSLEYLRELCNNTRQGVNLGGLKEAALSLGMNAVATEISIDQLVNNTAPPSILFWRQNHFVVLKKIRRIHFVIKLLKIDFCYERFVVADPAYGIISLSQETIMRNWTAGSDSKKGIVLLLEKNENFNVMELAVSNNKTQKKKGLQFIISYVKDYKNNLFALVVCMILGSVLNLLFPILNQRIVDTGIAFSDVNFIFVILIAQLFVFFGSTVLELLKSWILLFVNSRVSIILTSDFIIKMMKLPMKYFDVKLITDIIQRLNDNNRIQRFLTVSTLEAFFALGNFTLFSILLASYSLKIFLIFFSGSIFSVSWILLFMKRRASLDYSKFDIASENSNNILELVSGMSEIKLHNAEDAMRWRWEDIQVRLFSLTSKGLQLEQYQTIGNGFFTQLKNIAITFIAARAVIYGTLSLGEMLSISYIIGQMNAPISQLISFVGSVQDAKISLDRLNEINNRDDEDASVYEYIDTHLDHGANSADIIVSNASFKYDGTNVVVLNNLSLHIPEGKITAIVGTSGSGKTTLMKILLKFYKLDKGEIKIGEKNFNALYAGKWRKRCGVVMQDGYIFSTTIENNIALGESNIDQDRLKIAVRMANIQDYIELLPLKYKTVIGNAGSNISLGQKQRILIARAVYQNPKFLFFDEATSSLDANNEKVIMENLNEYFKGRTVVVIAHRLSTVKNAHQILVLDKGEIVEQGSHKELVNLKGQYYNLVRNQLELGY